MTRPSKRRRIHNPDTDIEELRARNNARLKMTFESIFEKYGRDFSGIGDEIDLETGKVLVNNGHLLGMKDETDAGADGDMLDELASEKLSDKIQSGKEVNFRSDMETRNGQAPEDGAISDGAWFSDDADSLLGDVIIPDHVGSGTHVSRLPDVQPQSENCALITSATAYGNFKVSDEGRLETNLSTRPPQDTESASWDDANSEPAWQPPSLPEPVSISVVRPAQMASGDDGDDGAGSIRFSSPVRPSLGTSTTWKRKSCNSPMNRWTQQENDLLLCLLSDTTLGYSEVKEKLNKRFPHRHLKAIQDHWNRLRVKDPWKSILKGRIQKHNISKRCQINPTRVSRTIRDDQQLCSLGGQADPAGLTLPDCASANAWEFTMSSDSSPQHKMSLQPDIQQDKQIDSIPTSQIATDIEFLSHRLRKHGRFLSAPSRLSMVEHDIHSTARQQLYLSTNFKMANESLGDTMAGLDGHLEPKPTGSFEEPEPAAMAENHEVMDPILHQELKIKTDNYSRHKAPNITAMRQAYAVQLAHGVTSYVRQSGSEDLTGSSYDGVQIRSDHQNIAEVAQEPPAAAISTSSNTDLSTPLPNPSSPKVFSIPRTHPCVNCQKHQQTQLCLPTDCELSETTSSTPCIDPQLYREACQQTPPYLPADRHVPQTISNLPSRKSGLASEPEIWPGSSRLLDRARRKCDEFLTPSAPVASTKLADKPNKAPCATASTLHLKSPNSSSADEASRAIKFLATATAPSTIGIDTPSQNIGRFQGVKSASVKPISPTNTDSSEDELSTPIKTVGTLSASRVTSATLKNRRKVLF